MRNNAIGSIRSACVTAALALALAAPAGANPVPAVYGMLHVMSYDPYFYFCDDNSIVTCDQIQEYSGDSGLMLFALFLVPDPIGEYDELEELEIWLSWPEQWIYWDFQPCYPGAVTVTLDGNSAMVHWLADTPVNWPVVEAFLAGLFIVDVERAGFLDIGRLDVNGGDFNGWGYRGYAGDSRCYCWTDCDEMEPPECRTRFSPESGLELSAGQGGMAQGILTAYILETCGPVFSADQPWLSVAPRQVNYYTWELTVTADAAGLPPGTHFGLIQSAAVCHDCALVELTVLGATGAPGEEPQTSAGSWSGLKALYR